MMELATRQLQGSCSTFPYPPSSWRRGSKLKHFVRSSYAPGNKDRFISLNCSLSSRVFPRVGASLVLGNKSKLLKISAFKGSNRHDESGGRATSSKSLKNPVKVSYLQHESEESSLESSNVQNVCPAPCTSADERTTRSLAIQNLFKYWLMLLRTTPQTRPVDEVIKEPTSTEASDVPTTVQKQERDATSKSVWCYFLGLDATIMIPLLIFTPAYIAVNILYGSEVSKELTPLWILGPLVIALYVKMFQAICVLYVFSFKQTVKVVKNLPAFASVVNDYIFRGKLKEAFGKHIWQSVIGMKNMDYKEVMWSIMKGLQGWLVERYLDFIESIWPFYCRTVRILKRANLI